MSRLLVVDDEPVICQSFQWVFGGTKVDVLAAGTVAEGWRRSQDDRPDVIVLDLQLPDESGMTPTPAGSGLSWREPGPTWNSW
jgi:two-component system, NtrC family, nitrogen regulation response regulator GlnG